MVSLSQAADARIQRQLDRISSFKGHAAVSAYGHRLGDLLQLVEAHQAKGGKAQGRRANLEAVDRAALVMLTGQFQGFVMDLFVDTWDGRYPSASGAALLEQLRFNNPNPGDIDQLFAVMGVKSITSLAEPRRAASKDGPAKGTTEPLFVRARKKHQARQVIAEMVVLRNASAHGSTLVKIQLADVTGYLIDTVLLAIGMSRVL